MSKGMIKWFNQFYNRPKCQDCESTCRTKEYTEYPGIMLCPGCYREREIDADWGAMREWDEQEKDATAERIANKVIEKLKNK